MGNGLAMKNKIMDMKEEIQKILDRNFTRGNNTKALEEFAGNGMGIWLVRLF